MDTLIPSPWRCWMLRLLGGNPLVRVSDRVEAGVVIITAAAALLLLPVAGAVGSAIYSSHAALYAQQARDRTQVTGTLVEDAAITDDQNRRIATAEVRWRTAGADHLDTLRVHPGAKATDPVTLWVDSHGNAAAAPIPTWQAGLDAVVLGAAAWLAMAAAAAAPAAWLRSRLRRWRGAQWDRDLAALVGHGAGHHGTGHTDADT